MHELRISENALSIVATGLGSEIKKNKPHTLDLSIPADQPLHVPARIQNLKMGKVKPSGLKEILEIWTHTHTKVRPYENLVKVFNVLENAECLTSLNLANNRLGKIDAHANELQSFFKEIVKNLVSLDLSGNKLHKSGYRLLEKGKKEVEDVFESHFFHISRAKRLKYLDLTNNEFTAKQLVLLSEMFEDSPHLESIKLSCPSTYLDKNSASYKEELEQGKEAIRRIELIAEKNKQKNKLESSDLGNALSSYHKQLVLWNSGHGSKPTHEMFSSKVSNYYSKDEIAYLDRAVKKTLFTSNTKPQETKDDPSSINEPNGNIPTSFLK